MSIFTDFFQSVSDLTNAQNFSIVIKHMYNALPDVFINTLAICFILTMLGCILRFIKGWL